MERTCISCMKPQLLQPCMVRLIEARTTLLFCARAARYLVNADLHSKSVPAGARCLRSRSDVHADLHLLCWTAKILDVIWWRALESCSLACDLLHSLCQLFLSSHMNMQQAQQHTCRWRGPARNRRLCLCKLYLLGWDGSRFSC